MAVDPSSIQIDLDRDAAFNDFSLVTLQERYLVPGETSPQQAFARAAAAFADDEAHAQRLYGYVNRGWFMFATPLLSNGGTSRGLPISCFLPTVDDSLEGIFDHYKEVAYLSAKGGGVGSYYGFLRTLGERTSKGSSSGGMMPFAAIDDRVILGVSQGDTRRGSHAIYIDIHHPEIEEFIVSRKRGGDPNRKVINLHHGVVISDKFMEAVRDDLPFDLISPKDGSVRKTLKARDLWRLLLDTRLQEGEPYMIFGDTCNRALPEAQKALGLKMHHSNLCVVGSTNILTEGGWLPIGALAGTTQKVWNGAEFSEVDIRQTNPVGAPQELVRVWMEDGDYIDCTPYHKFYLEDGREVRAGELRQGMKLEPAKFPLAPASGSEGENTAGAYVAGWATFGGFEDNNRLAVFAPAGLGEGGLRRLVKLSVDQEHDDEGTTMRYEPSTVQTGFAPLTAAWSISDRKNWLGGALDAAGAWTQDDEGVHWYVVGSTDAQLIRDMRLTALSIGVDPRIRLTDTMNAFMLSALDMTSLRAEGYVNSVSLEDCRSRRSDEYAAPQVADVHPLPYRADVYCASEPQRQRLAFNGYLTGNCTEITLVTGPDHLGKDRTAVCCLSSVNAEMFDEWKDDVRFIDDLMRMLDNTLQEFIDKAPPEMGRAAYSAMRERAVGLGMFGFHTYLQRNNVAYGSDEARTIRLKLAAHLRVRAEAASLSLGKERGEAPDMAGTGQRFSHKLAYAPNASSSIICPTYYGSGTSAATEPMAANAYLHKTLSGSFPVRNPYLKALLQSAGFDTPEVWKSIIGAGGSVQHLDFLTAHEKDVYKTAFEIDQRWIVRQNADTTSLICQAQSTNVFLPHDVSAEELSELHYMAWELGCKSLYYLRSSTPKRAENTNDKVERATVDLSALAAVAQAPAAKDEDCFMCQG